MTSKEHEIIFENKRIATNKAFNYRFLISSKIADIINGEGCVKIKELMKKYNCELSIPESKGAERVFTLNCSSEDCIQIWDECLSDIQDTLKDQGEMDLRLLCHRSTVGAVIGKAGCRVNALRATHPVSLLKVYTDTAPLSSDRIVQIVGTAVTVLACLHDIFNILNNEPVTGAVTNYNPDNYDETFCIHYGGWTPDCTIRDGSSNTLLSSIKRNRNPSYVKPASLWLKEVQKPSYDINTNKSMSLVHYGPKPKHQDNYSATLVQYGPITKVSHTSHGFSRNDDGWNSLSKNLNDDNHLAEEMNEYFDDLETDSMALVLYNPQKDVTNPQFVGSPQRNQFNVNNRWMKPILGVPNRFVTEENEIDRNGGYFNRRKTVNRAPFVRQSQPKEIDWDVASFSRHENTKKMDSSAQMYRPGNSVPRDLGCKINWNAASFNREDVSRNGSSVQQLERNTRKGDADRWDTFLKTHDDPPFTNNHPSPGKINRHEQPDHLPFRLSNAPEIYQTDSSLNRFNEGQDIPRYPANIIQKDASLYRHETNRFDPQVNIQSIVQQRVTTFDPYLNEHRMDKNDVQRLSEIWTERGNDNGRENRGDDNLGSFGIGNKRRISEMDNNGIGGGTGLSEMDYQRQMAVAVPRQYNIERTEVYYTDRKVVSLRSENYVISRDEKEANVRMNDPLAVDDRDRDRDRACDRACDPVMVKRARTNVSMETHGDTTETLGHSRPNDITEPVSDKSRVCMTLPLKLPLEKLSEIMKESQAEIMIRAEKGVIYRDQVVSIGGTKEQIEAAMCLIHLCVKKSR